MPSPPRATRLLPLLALLIVLPAATIGCGERAQAAREIGQMEPVTAMHRAIDLQREGLGLLESVQDVPTAEAAAERLDFIAYQLETLAARLRETGPPTSTQQLESIDDTLQVVFEQGLPAVGHLFRLLAEPELLKILQPANDRYEAATKEVAAALSASPG